MHAEVLWDIFCSLFLHGLNYLPVSYLTSVTFVCGHLSKTYYQLFVHGDISIISLCRLRILFQHCMEITLEPNDRSFIGV